MSSPDDILDRAAAIVEQATPGPCTIESDDSGIYLLLGDLRGEDEHLAVYTAPYNDGEQAALRRVRDAQRFALAPSLGAALALAKAVERATGVVSTETTDGLTAALAAFKASLAESIKED